MSWMRLIIGSAALSACQAEPEDIQLPGTPYPDCELNADDDCVCGLDNVIVSDWTTVFSAMLAGDDCRSIVECAQPGTAVRGASYNTGFEGTTDYYNADGEHISTFVYTDAGTVDSCRYPMQHWLGQPVRNCWGGTTSLWPACVPDVLNSVVLSGVDASPDVGLLTGAASLDAAQSFASSTCIAQTTCVIAQQDAVIWLRVEPDTIGISLEYIAGLQVDAFNAATGDLMATAELGNRIGELPVSCLQGPYTASPGCAVSRSESRSESR